MHGITVERVFAAREAMVATSTTQFSGAQRCIPAAHAAFLERNCPTIVV
jgi:hypothetical protein